MKHSQQDFNFIDNCEKAFFSFCLLAILTAVTIIYVKIYHDNLMKNDVEYNLEDEELKRCFHLVQLDTINRDIGWGN